MRKLFAYITAILLTAGLFAQSPERISYQAVVRDVENNLVRNKTVGMQISILQESPEGTAVYIETQTPATNDNGLVSIEIGGGTEVSGDFASIDWADGAYFIKTESDPEGGTEYSISGTSQFLSVPYALFAREAGNVPDVSGIATNTQAIQDTAAKIRDDIPNISESDPSVPIGTQVGEMQYWDGSQWITVAAGSEGQVLTFANNIPTWKKQLKDEGDVENPLTGKIWMDQNLGALRVATSSTDSFAYGDLYQWGRAADGHQSRSSATTFTLSSSDIPGHADFIVNTASPRDWRSPQNDNLWQGVNGINNPCPSGYRIPTIAEWKAEIDTWPSKDFAGAFNSPLKLPLPGVRYIIEGVIDVVGTNGYYWSSTTNGTSSQRLTFNSSNADLGGVYRGYGMSVRCIKDYAPPTESVTNPVTGKTWMDRNLGALRVATSSSDDYAYGDLYQWGRDADGHQTRTSGTRTTLSSSDTVGHGEFITSTVNPKDWRSPQNDNLWQGVNGTNNPCPAGYRIPTQFEWEAERQSWSSNNAAGAFASPLKLPHANHRGHASASVLTGSDGYYWSSTVNGTFSQRLYFNSSNAFLGGVVRGYGMSVRCIEDFTPATETVTNPTTGKTWMDRNLGASQVATSSTDAEAYGDLFQWGRAADGHQIRTSGTTISLSSSDTVGHDLFINTAVNPADWRSPQNDNLWQGVSGTNNPCPTGFRLPTDTEWDAEIQSWSSANAAGAFASELKLPLPGVRISSGVIDVVGTQGYYWSSTTNGTQSRNLYMYNSSAFITDSYRGVGFSVRCIED